MKLKNTLGLAIAAIIRNGMQAQAVPYYRSLDHWLNRVC